MRLSGWKKPLAKREDRLRTLPRTCLSKQHMIHIARQLIKKNGVTHFWTSSNIWTQLQSNAVKCKAYLQFGTSIFFSFETLC